MFHRFLFIGIVTAQTAAEILRLECGTDASFSVIQQDKRLHDSYYSLHDTDKFQCQYECSQDKRCKSINVHEADYVCYLNAKSSMDPRDRVSLSSQTGWTFYSPLYNETAVGINCRRKNPCEETQKCMDTCECPGYTCIDKYKVVEQEKVNWRVALEKCRSMGGDLASFVNRKEEDTIKGLLSMDRRYWIGLSDYGQFFQWTDGTHWIKYQSDEDKLCIAVRRNASNTLKYRNVYCKELRHFICKFF